MRCPYCGEEMEKGYIYGKRDLGIPWIPASDRPPLLWKKSSVQAHNGIMLSEPALLSPVGCTRETWVCRTCKKGLLP